MARFRCVCDYSISTSNGIPNPNEWHCLSDTDFQAFTELVNSEDIYMQSTIMYRCPNSGHPWIFWDGFDRAPALYDPIPSTWRDLAF